MALEALDAQSFNLADLSAALSVATAGLETHQAALQAELSGMAESLDAAERMFQREQSALLRRREELRKNIDIARESEEEARERLVVEQRLYDLDRAERLERAKQQERAARDALRDKDSEVDKLRADKKKKLEEHGAETTRAVQAVRTRFAARRDCWTNGEGGQDRLRLQTGRVRTGVPEAA
jgi:isoleucyl-tRNA synthetase